MWYVKLNNVLIRANHGVYEQEKILGNDFIVNISVGFEASEINHLHQTIDYVMLYNITKHEMEIPSKLLEEVIGRIMQTIEIQIPNAKEIFISIKKQHPAFGMQVSETEVCLQKYYH
jgi:7,8-dihydroneopterin aldolase/epimerase/oxygenase